MMSGMSHFSGYLWLWCALASAWGSPVYGSNAHDQCANNLKMLQTAFDNYRQDQGDYPTDIVDGNGMPLLSWRVRLLPYLEHSRLYQRFRLDEPWDSAHNLNLLPLMPSCYRCPAADVAKGETVYVVPRGPTTALSMDGQHWRVVRGDPSRTILLLEVDKLHAVVWTQPIDWRLSTHGTSGIGKWHRAAGVLEGRGAMVTFHRGQPGTLPDVIGRRELESLLSATTTRKPELVLPGYRVMSLPEIARIALPALGWAVLLLFCSAPAVVTLGRGGKIALGELPLLAMALTSLVFWIVVLKRYSLGLVRPSVINLSDRFLFWSLPSAVTLLTLYFGRNRVAPSVAMKKFIPGASILALIYLTASFVPSNVRFLEEAFLTYLSPSLFLLLGLGAVVVSLHSEKELLVRHGFCHWLGIGLCVVPFLWWAANAILLEWVEVRLLFPHVAVSD